MRTKNLPIYLILIVFATNVLAQNDSATIDRKKQYFVGGGAGIGLGWRKYKPNIPDSLIMHKYFPKTEAPGMAMGLLFELWLNY